MKKDTYLLTLPYHSHATPRRITCRNKSTFQRKEVERKDHKIRFVTPTEEGYNANHEHEMILSTKILTLKSIIAKDKNKENRKQKVKESTHLLR